MKRSSFLKSLLPIPFIGTITNGRSTDANHVSLSDVFDNTVFDNSGLYYLKNGYFRDYFFSKIQEKIKENAPFSYTGFRHLILDKKEVYSRNELQFYFDMCARAINRHYAVSQYPKGDPVRWIYHHQDTTFHMDALVVWDRN